MTATVHTLSGAEHDVEKLSEKEWNEFLIVKFRELGERLDRIERGLGGSVPRKNPLTLVRNGGDNA